MPEFHKNLLEWFDRSKKKKNHLASNCKIFNYPQYNGKNNQIKLSISILNVHDLLIIFLLYAKLFNYKRRNGTVVLSQHNCAGSYRIEPHSCHSEFSITSKFKFKTITSLVLDYLNTVASSDLEVHLNHCDGV